jgi:hypothetical protein
LTIAQWPNVTKIERSKRVQKKMHFLDFVADWIFFANHPNPFLQFPVSRWHERFPEKNSRAAAAAADVSAETEFQTQQDFFKTPFCDVVVFVLHTCI